MAVIEWGPAAVAARDEGMKLGSCPSLLQSMQLPADGRLALEARLDNGLLECRGQQLPVPGTVSEGCSHCAICDAVRCLALYRTFSLR